MSAEGPKPYNVVYDADNGLQYSFQTGYVPIPEAPLNAITQLTGDVTAMGPGSVVATIAEGAVTEDKINSGASNAGQVLTSAGDGTAVFADSTGTPAGENSDVQFNNGGSFGGDGRFVFNTATGDIALGDGQKILLGNGGNAFIFYDSSIGHLITQTNMGGISNFSSGLEFNMVANVYTSNYPSIDMRSDGNGADLIIASPNGTSFSPVTNSAADPSAMVDVQSTTKGFLLPRMSSAQRTAISSPAEGLLVYDTDTFQQFQWQNGAWVPFSIPTPSTLTPALLTTTQTATTSPGTSYVVTALTNTFALSDSANKVKITLSAPTQTAVSSSISITVFRDSTDLETTGGGFMTVGPLTPAQFPACFTYLDTPGDTASHTYAIYVKEANAGSGVQFISSGTGVMILEEVV